MLDGLTGIDLDLRLSAAKIAIARAKLGRTAVAANLRGGKLTVTVGELQAFGGVIKGSLTLATTDVGADFKSQLQFIDVDLESCLGEMFSIRRIEGRGNLAFAVEASGGSVLALTQNINGTASLNGREGALLRLNAEQLLSRLKRRPLSGAGDFRSGRTPFDKLDRQPQDRAGQGQRRAGDARRAQGADRAHGYSSIPTRELDLRGTASPARTRANDTSPPFRASLHGAAASWDDPHPAAGHPKLDRTLAVGEPAAQRAQGTQARYRPPTGRRRQWRHPAASRAVDSPARPRKLRNNAGLSHARALRLGARDLATLGDQAPRRRRQWRPPRS